eukprot:COSAG04_NODE_236_length_19126_cov_8.932885_13_plen_317_part_00
MEPPPAQLVLSGRALLGAVIVLPLAVFGITFPVSFYVNAHPTRQLFTFLSNTIDYPPASCIGTFGLVLAIASLLTVMVLRHLLLSERLARASLGGSARAAEQDAVPNPTLRSVAGQKQLEGWRASSARCLCCGVVSMLGALVVCSVQPHVDIQVHMAGAAVFFLGGAVFTTWQTVLDSRLAASLPHCLPSQAAALSGLGALDGAGLRLRKCAALLTLLTFLGGFVMGAVASPWALPWLQQWLALTDGARERLVSFYGPLLEMILLLLFVLHFASLLPLFCRQRPSLVLSVSWSEEAAGNSLQTGGSPSSLHEPLRA